MERSESEEKTYFLVLFLSVLYLFVLCPPRQPRDAQSLVPARSTFALVAFVFHDVVFLRIADGQKTCSSLYDISLGVLQNMEGKRKRPVLVKWAAAGVEPFQRNERAGEKRDASPLLGASRDVYWKRTSV